MYQKNTFNRVFLFSPFRELEEARVQQKNSPQRKIGLGSQTRNSRVIGHKVNRSMSLSVIMWMIIVVNTVLLVISEIMFYLFYRIFLTGYLEFRLYEIINFLYFYITQGFIESNILKMKQNWLYKDELF